VSIGEETGSDPEPVWTLRSTEESVALSEIKHSSACFLLAWLPIDLEDGGRNW
jgi:hypothetical protein